MKKTIVLSEELHKKIKIYCAKNNHKINLWIEEQLQKLMEKKEVENVNN